jgi:hypothetical protein
MKVEVCTFETSKVFALLPLLVGFGCGGGVLTAETTVFFLFDHIRFAKQK